MKTRYWLLRPDNGNEMFEAELAEDPKLDRLHALIDPLLDGGDLEHVYVLTPALVGYGDGERTSMFVDEKGHLKGLPPNEVATTIYRANWLRQHPGTAPETLPWIAGPAVLFERLVWF